MITQSWMMGRFGGGIWPFLALADFTVGNYWLALLDFFIAALLFFPHD